MLKSIVQTSIRTTSVRNGIAALLQKSTSKAEGLVQCVRTASYQQRSDRQDKHTCLLPLTSERIREGPPSSQPLADDALCLSLSRLCLSPEEAAATIQYRLPSASPVTQDAILDPLATVAIPVDLPTAISRDFIDVPSSRHGSDSDVAIGDPIKEGNDTKKASNILHKRHRKMKRHQYKKWRKRNRFKLRMMKQRRRKKQRQRWERHLSRYRFTELSAAEREQYLEKKREKLHIFLRYLGVPVDDIIMDKEVSDQEVNIGKKKRKGPRRIMSSEGSGKIVPEPILPKGVVFK